MKLTTKATLLVLGNAVLTIGIGLAARDLLLNPELQVIEQAQDTKDVTRLERGIANIQRALADRIGRIAATTQLISGETTMPWHTLAAAMGAGDSVDYAIASADDGSLAVVRPGEFGAGLDRQPSPTAINQILLRALQKIPPDDISPGKWHQPHAGILDTVDGPVVYAAGVARLPGYRALSRLILIQRLDQSFLSRLAHNLDIDVAAISQEAFLRNVGTHATKLGQRTRNNRLYWVINDDDGRPVLQLQFVTAARAYDTRILSPTIVVAIITSIALWIIALAWFRNHTVRPINQLGIELRNIRHQNAFDKRLEYRSRDEVADLVRECNELLSHVDSHTRELHGYSYTDPLTGIGNRRYFEAKLGDLWQLCQREQMPLAIIVLDIDFFKQYNDTYGHDAGDRALKQFANLLGKSLKRGTDVIARTGGEEFSAILFDTPERTALKLAERIVNAMSYKRVPHAASSIADHVTVSAGVASLIPNELLRSEDLINQADHALYSAKRLGRNRVAAFRRPTVLSAVPTTPEI